VAILATIVCKLPIVDAVCRIPGCIMPLIMHLGGFPFVWSLAVLVLQLQVQ